MRDKNKADEETRSSPIARGIATQECRDRIEMEAKITKGKRVRETEAHEGSSCETDMKHDNMKRQRESIRKTSLSYFHDL